MTGQWHSLIPKDPAQNVALRVALLEECKTNRKLRAGVMAACAQDIVFWIDLFVIQHNPDDFGDEIGPFICWDFQPGVIERTMNRLFVQRRKMVWEKSREMGATWLILIIVLWMCLFKRNKNFLFVSHSEDAVEKAGKRNTLFYKLSFIIAHLPDWMKEGCKKRRLSYNFAATNSSIEGSATTERTGVGGRNTAIVADEFGRYPRGKDYEILGQIEDTGPCLFISTHYGTGTAFYELTQRKGMAKEVMHWLHHPKKKQGAYRYEKDGNKVVVLDKQYQYPPEFRFVMTGQPVGGPYPCHRSPWYDAEDEERKSLRNLAMHLDINPKGSVEQAFDALLIRELQDKHCRAPDWVGTIAYDKEAKPQGFRSQGDGPLRLWLLPTPDGGVPAGVYKLGCDISAGRGNTCSTISVINARSGEKVAEYGDSQIEPHDLAVYAVALCRIFKDANGNPAQLAWELPGPGQKFGERVVALKHLNVYMKTKEHTMQNIPSTQEPGWTNSNESMLGLMTDYRDALYKGDVLNFSKGALDECLNFRFNDQGWIEHAKYVSIEDPRGARVNHADQAVADALAWKLCKGIVSVRQPEQKQIVPHNSLAWRQQEAEAKKRSRSGWALRRA